MSSGVFCKKMYHLMRKAGYRQSDVVIHTADGKYTAEFPDGTKITGNPACDSLWVQWGSGHSAIARI